MRKPRAFTARKALGQNFLHDDNIVRKIAAVVDPQPDDHIVEIGPGFGALTGYLLSSGCRYVGIEVDDRLTGPLKKQFADVENFELMQADFRKVQLASLQKDRRLRLVGNIPYHITSSILFKALESRETVHDMVLMVQKEVGERIVAESGSKAYGILSVLSQTFSRPELAFTVPRSVFRPRPDVDSVIVRWDFTRPHDPLPADGAHFTHLVKSVFNQRRKMLRNTLRKHVDVAAFAPHCGIDLEHRPEDLSVSDFITLSTALLRFTEKQA